MDNGPEPTPRGPKWPNKARKCILRPIRIHPCASQPLVAPEKIPQAIFHLKIGQPSSTIWPNLANSPKAIWTHRSIEAKPFRPSCRSLRVSATPPNISP